MNRQEKLEQRKDELQMLLMLAKPGSKAEEMIEQELATVEAKLNSQSYFSVYSLIKFAEA